MSEDEALLVEARERFPRSFAVAAAYAASPLHQGGTEEAARRWKIVTDAFPMEPEAHAALCSAFIASSRFDEADRLSTASIERFPDNLPIFGSYARSAEARRDWEGAYRRWQCIAERFDGAVIAHAGMVFSLCGRLKFDEAQTRLESLALAFPHQRRLLEAVMLAVQVRRDRPKSILKWDILLEASPHSASAHEGRVSALREGGRLIEAEAALDAARALFPQSAHLAAEAARLAAARSDWDQAIDAWQGVRKLTPTSPQPLLEISDILLRQKRYQEADTLLKGELEAFADQADVAIRYAEVAKRRKALDEAVRRWTGLEPRFPKDPRILTGLAETLWMMRDEQAYAPVVERLLANHPDHFAAAILYARLELRRNRAGDAVARLVAAAERWPSNRAVLTTLADARLQALMEGEEGGAHASVSREASPAETALAPANLFERFESLGGDVRGCEFGLLQRHFGAEPLGLMRWGAITPQGLINMIERRFEGLGNLDNTCIESDQTKEYRLTDTLYEMEMHTFISTSTEPAEKLLPKLAKRQRFLARMLMENMQEAQKIFVYKMEEPMAPELAQRLWRAVRAYGDNALLLVGPADAGRLAGSLEIIEPSLMVGAVDRFATTDISVEPWQKVCTLALEAWSKHKRR